jgi:hypothetical protein
MSGRSIKIVFLRLLPSPITSWAGLLVQHQEQENGRLRYAKTEYITTAAVSLSDHLLFVVELGSSLLFRTNLLLSLSLVSLILAAAANPFKRQ